MPPPLRTATRQSSVAPVETPAPLVLHTRNFTPGLRTHPVPTEAHHGAERCSWCASGEHAEAHPHEDGPVFTSRPPAVAACGQGVVSTPAAVGRCIRPAWRVERAGSYRSPQGTRVFATVRCREGSWEPDQRARTCLPGSFPRFAPLLSLRPSCRSRGRPQRWSQALLPARRMSKGYRLIAAVTSLAKQTGGTGGARAQQSGRSWPKRASYCLQPTSLGSRVPIGTEVEIIGVDWLTLRVRLVAKEART